MQYDIALVTGVLLAFLAAPAVVSAFAGGRSPRGAVLLAVVGGSLIVFATLASPTGYRAGDFPQVVMRVVAWAIR